MNCADAQHRAHWPDEPPLAPTEKAAVEAHISGCLRCQEALGVLHSLDDLFTTGPMSQLDPAPGDIPAVASSLALLEARLAARTAGLSQRTAEHEDAVPAEATTDVSWWQRLVSLFGQVRPLAYAIPVVMAVVLAWSVMPSHPSHQSLSAFDAGQVNPPNRPVVRGLWNAKGGIPPLVDLLFASPEQSLRGFSTPRLAKAGQRLHPGDFLQLRYTMPRQAQAMVMSMNARGEISAFYPFQGTKSAPLAAGEGVLPPEGAWELDDYIGAERIYLFVGLKAFGVAQVKATLRASFRKAGRHQLPRCKSLSGPLWCRSFGLLKQP